MTPKVTQPHDAKQIVFAIEQKRANRYLANDLFCVGFILSNNKFRAGLQLVLNFQAMPSSNFASGDSPCHTLRLDSLDGSGAPKPEQLPSGFSPEPLGIFMSEAFFGPTRQAAGGVQLAKVVSAVMPSQPISTVCASSSPCRVSDENSCTLAPSASVASSLRTCSSCVLAAP